MAENEYNDEYQFDELDGMESESLDEEAGSDLDKEGPAVKKGGGGPTKVRRNALIVVAVVVLLMLTYKFFSSFFSTKKPSTQAIPSVPVATKSPPPAETTTVVPVPQQLAATQPPEQPTAPVTEQPRADNTQVEQKLSSLETSQEDVRSEVSSVSTKLNDINTNVSQLTEKITNLNQMITALTSKLEQQSIEIAVLTERTKPKLIRRPIVLRAPSLLYYIQAIIPGRAWLIATNGSTITVREGTQIAGYGVVKLIDPNQGRVVTTSGRVIRFSQEDS